MLKGLPLRAEGGRAVGIEGQGASGLSKEVRGEDRRAGRVGPANQGQQGRSPGRCGTCQGLGARPARLGPGPLAPGRGLGPPARPGGSGDVSAPRGSPKGALCADIV